MTNKDKQLGDLVSVVARASGSTAASAGQAFTQAVGTLIPVPNGANAATPAMAAPNGNGELSSEALTQNTQQLSQLIAALERQVGATADNTRAVADNTSAKSSGAASTAGNMLMNIFGGALSMNPIVSGLMSLFGGSGSATATTPTKFALPNSLDLQAVVSGTQGMTPVSYGENGLPRPATPTATQQQQVTVNIQAMDSRSFLDHSSDIADAIKQALLNSHSLNDVIGEL